MKVFERGFVNLQSIFMPVVMVHVFPGVLYGA